MGLRMVGTAPSLEALGEGYWAALGRLGMEEAGAGTGMEVTSKSKEKDSREEVWARCGAGGGVDYSWGAVSRLGN